MYELGSFFGEQHMTTIQSIYLIVIFVVVFGVALAILLQLGARPIQKRLEGVAADNSELSPQQAAPAWVQRVVKLSGPLARVAWPQQDLADCLLPVPEDPGQLPAD